MLRNIDICDLELYYNEENSELNLSNIELTFQDIKEVIEYLQYRPGIKKLKVNACNLEEECAMLLVNFHQVEVQFVSINQLNNNSEVFNILHETNPVTIANYGRGVGLETEVPSLLKQTLFYFKSDLNETGKYTQEEKEQILKEIPFDLDTVKPKI